MLDTVVCNPNCVTTSSGLGAALGVLLIVYIAIAVIGVIATVKIVTKAGYSGWWVLIWLVPLVGFVFFLIFAFSDWPVLQRLRAAEGAASYGGPSGYAAHYVAPSPGPGYPPPPPATARPTSAEPESPAAPLPSFWGGPQSDEPATSPTPPSPPPAAPVAPQVPAGWYPQGGRERWWDGTEWTDHTR